MKLYGLQGVKGLVTSPARPRSIVERGLAPKKRGGARLIGVTSNQAFYGGSFKDFPLSTPEGVMNGDQLVAVVSIGTAAATFTLPSGWEFLSGLGVTGVVTRVAIKVAAGEPDSRIFAGSSTGSYNGMLFAFRGGTKVACSQIGALANVQFAPNELMAAGSGVAVALAALAESSMAVATPDGLSFLASAGPGGGGGYPVSQAFSRQVVAGERFAPSSVISASGNHVDTAFIVSS